MSNELLFAQSHEWLRKNADGTVTVGISDHAQSALGDITYIQLPKVGAKLAQSQVFGVVESVKAASDLYAPVAGEVLAINTALDASPDLVNTAPETDGWMLKLKPDTADTAHLMDAAAYAATLS